MILTIYGNRGENKPPFSSASLGEFYEFTREGCGSRVNLEQQARTSTSNQEDRFEPQGITANH